MNFLAGLGVKVIEFLLGDLLAWATKKYEEWRARRQIEQDAKKSVEPLKDAKTGAEIDKGADDALGKF